MSLQEQSRLCDSDPRRWRNHGEFVMLMLIAFYFNDQKGAAWPSISHLAELTRMKRRSVMRILQELERRELIQRIPGGGKRHTRYRLRLSPLTGDVQVTGDPMVTSAAREVTQRSPGGDATGTTGDVPVTSPVTPASPDQRFRTPIRLPTR